MNGKAVIQRERNYLVLFSPDNKRIAYEQIPASGKTLQIEVKLANIARDLGYKVR